MSWVVKFNLPAAPGLISITYSKMRESVPYFCAVMGNAILVCERRILSLLLAVSRGRLARSVGNRFCYVRVRGSLSYKHPGGFACRRVLLGAWAGGCLPRVMEMAGGERPGCRGQGSSAPNAGALSASPLGQLCCMS